VDNCLPDTTDIDTLDDFVCDFIHCIYFENDGRRRYVAESLTAGLAMIMPRVKGRLLLANRALRGWKKLHPSRAWPPLSRSLTVAIAVSLARAGRWRLAVATLLAFDCLLRVSELMNLRVRDIAFAGDVRLNSDFEGAAIALPSTKTGPNKFVNVLDPDVVLLLKRAVHGLRLDSFVFPSTTKARTDCYRRALKHACAELGLAAFRFVPHSLRHGGATHMHLQPERFDIADIAHRGRWKSVESALHYCQQGRALLLSTQIPEPLASAAPVLARNVLLALSLAQNSMPAKARRAG
jgi:integrase